jgi:hypothetical protein
MVWYGMHWQWKWKCQWYGMHWKWYAMVWYPLPMVCIGNDNGMNWKWCGMHWKSQWYALEMV